MKYIIPAITIFILSVRSYGQQTPMEFLNMVPKPATNLCGLTMEEKQKYMDELARFDTLYRQKLNSQKEASEKFEQEHQEEMTVNALIKAGYSREDAEKMKDLDNMSEAEQMAMADKMLQNKYYMDMAELNKVAEYDSVTLGRWGKAQSTIAMTDAQIDPEGNEKKQLDIKNDLELQQEIIYLTGKLNSGENKYLEQIRELDIKADSARAKMKPELDRLYENLNSGSGHADQIIESIKLLRQNFCGAFTPSYLDIAEAYKGYIEEHWQEYYRWEELQMELTERQVGMHDPNYKPGVLAMGKVGSYYSMVSAAFKYNQNLDWGNQFIGY